MKIGGLSSPKPEPPAAKPVSATLCHALAALSFAGAALLVLAALVRAIDEGGFYAAGGAAVSGLVWWVIGDVVAGISRRSEKK